MVKSTQKRWLWQREFCGPGHILMSKSFRLLGRERPSRRWSFANELFAQFQ